MRQYSIRRRLVSGTLVSMMLILGATGIAAYLFAQHESEEIFSARLATSARVLEALVARQLEKASISRPLVIALPKELEHATGDAPEEYGHPYETKIAFQVWDTQGILLARSASAPEVALGALKAGFSRNTIGDEVWQVFSLPSGNVWIMAAEKDEVRREMVDELGMSILVPLVVGGLLTLLAVNLVLSVNLTSLRELANRIAKREPESLAQIELPETPVELVPIITELNHLLHRVKLAFEREKRFMDAAAHEIRTPIAALQIHVQNAMRAGSAQEREMSLAEALVGLRRTTKLAEQLLSFSRLAAEADPRLFHAVSLNQICCEVIADQEPLLAGRGQLIGFDATQECLVWGDAYKIQRLLHNLIDNASQHGARAGEIQVGVERQGRRAVLRVSNDGDAIPDDETVKIFTPYYRVPGRAAFGSGLGLAIVKEIAGQHDASVQVDSKADGQGVIVSVSFPLADMRKPG